MFYPTLTLTLDPQVSKRKGEEYQLLWKKETDFVRIYSVLPAPCFPQVFKHE